jgi:hypothetical protein
MNIYSPTISGSLTISGSIITTGGGLPLTGSLVSSGSFTSIGNTTVSGSLTVYTSGNSVEFQVLGTGTQVGNAYTDNHTITGSLAVSGSTSYFGATHQFTGSLLVSGSVGVGTNNPSAVFEVARATTSSINLANFFNSGSITGTENYIWVGKDGSTTGRAGLIDFIDNTDGASGYLALAVQGDNPKSGNGFTSASGEFPGRA